MNADQLLAHYDRIADAPDAIPRLRRFILDLAVRGKLVPQDPDDEPAAELLKRIEADKERLVKSGKVKKTKALPYVTEGPFALPFNWQWTRLRNILTKLTDGTHHSPPNGPTGEFKYITAKNIKDQGISLGGVTYVTREIHEGIFARCDPAKGDVLYIKDGATTGIVTINDLDEAFSLLSSVALLKLPSCLYNRLIVEFLRSPFFYDQMRGFMKGAAITRVTLKRMAPALIPLPPLTEQARIVARVDELMALCDRLAAARDAREAARDRLAAASLARLNRPDPDPKTFRDHAAFTLKTFAPLTTRPDQIKAFRQTILNLAVRGKLVEQDPADESVPELLERLKKAQISAYRSEGLRTRPPVAKLSRADMWFEFPKTWALSFFDELFVIVSGVTKGQKVPADEAVEVPYLRVANVQRGNLDLSTIKKIAVRIVDEERYALRSGDVLMTEGGDWDKLGRAAIWREEIPGCIHQNHIFRVRPPSGDVLSEWVTIYVNSQLGRAFFENASKQTTNLASINMTQLRGCPFPLPPVAEQHRIVAKINSLVAVCDRLEASLIESDTTRDRLFDAILNQALSPAEEVLPAMAAARG